MTERMAADVTSAEARYKMLFPLSIPASLLTEQTSGLPDHDIDPAATSRAASIRSEPPMQNDTASIDASSTVDPEYKEANFKRHSSNSFRPYPSTHSKAGSTLRNVEG
jgi:hypothetical protein